VQSDVALLQQRRNRDGHEPPKRQGVTPAGEHRAAAAAHASNHCAHVIPTVFFLHIIYMHGICTVVNTARYGVLLARTEYKQNDDVTA
jgi:hypothetical protein